MKKTLKILAIILMAVLLFFALAQPSISLAAGANEIIGGLSKNETAGQTEIQSIGSQIMSIIWIASIVIAVVVLMYTGVKFIVGSASEKAEYKKSLVPLVVGVLILVFATTIVQALFSINVK